MKKGFITICLVLIAVQYTLLFLFFHSLVFAQPNESAPRQLDVPKAEVTGIFHLADKVVEGWLAFLDWLGRTFEPIVGPIFRPMSNFLERTYQPWAKICALGLFIGTILWVWFGMRKEYVNLGRQSESIWTDLRWWTIFSMLPHIIVYLYF